MSLRYAIVAGPSVIALTLMGSAGSPAEGSFPGANGKIAFTRFLNEGGAHIFVMNADGSDVTRVTESPGNDFGPAWSPDGSKIAFTRVDAITSPGLQGQYDPV